MIFIRRLCLISLGLALFDRHHSIAFDIHLGGLDDDAAGGQFDATAAHLEFDDILRAVATDPGGLVI